MNTAEDPFAHHPRLRDQIVPPETSFFRGLTTDSIRAMMAENGIFDAPLHSDATREALRADYLARRAPGDLWVFAYGSLMWDPGFVFAEVRRAHAGTYARRMILKDYYGARGDKACPGLMAALDEGGGCDGLAFRIAADRVAEETRILWQREIVLPAYIAHDIPLAIGDTTITALTFVADHDSAAIDAGIARDEQLHLLARSAGILGSSLDYLRGIVAKLRLLDIEDTELFGLLDDAQALAARADQRPLAL